MASFDVHGFIMDTLEAMKDGDATEWEVKSAALEKFPKYLTAADLETVAGWFEDNDG